MFCLPCRSNEQNFLHARYRLPRLYALYRESGFLTGMRHFVGDLFALLQAELKSQTMSLCALRKKNPERPRAVKFVVAAAISADQWT